MTLTIISTDLVANLDEGTIRGINVFYSKLLYRHLLMPAGFSKPTRYSGERERRLLFELPMDVDRPYIDISVPEAIEFVRFL